jgi:hypothetical protein
MYGNERLTLDTIFLNSVLLLLLPLENCGYRDRLRRFYRCDLLCMRLHVVVSPRNRASTLDFPASVGGVIKL